MSLLDKPLRATAVDPADRDAVNELYDRACDLLLAAEGIRTAAAEPGSAAAIAATLGCIEASLAALEHATAGMRREVDRKMSATTATLATESGVSSREARAGFSVFVDALEEAQRAADELRERTGPLLARLTLG